MPGTGAALDTSADVRRRLVAGWRGMTTTRKAALVDALSADATRLAVTGIRTRHPDAAPEEVMLRLAALRLPAALLREAFGWDPGERGY